MHFTQQTFFRWPVADLVYINSINVPGSFKILSKPFKTSVVHNESQHGQFLSYEYKSKWINLIYSNWSSEDES